MHYVISTTWGPTDTTRASLPFIFSATALSAGDSVMIMLFHDSVSIGVQGAYEGMQPVGPAPKFAEVFANPQAEIVVCEPCAKARGITESMLAEGLRFGGMGDFYRHVSREDSKVVTF